MTSFSRKPFFRAVLLGSVALASLLGPSLPRASAQTLTPAPLPTLGPIPGAPASAQITFDEEAIKQLMYLVELSRLFTGGVGQLLSSSQKGEQLLGFIRDGIIGIKIFPKLNGPDEVKGREGGPSLMEMADGALTGGALGPQAVVDALNAFRPIYKLDDAFALRNDTAISKVLIAHAAASGAIAASTGEDSYKRANASMNRLNDYLLALAASPDLKTSMDINTRVMIEAVQQMNEMLRTQAAIVSVAGTYFMVLGGEAGNDDSLLGLDIFNR